MFYPVFPGASFLYNLMGRWGPAETWSHSRCRIETPQSCARPGKSGSAMECRGVVSHKRYFPRLMCYSIAPVLRAACSVVMLDRKLEGVLSFQAAENSGFLDVIFWAFVTHYWGHDPTIPEKSKTPKIGLTTFGSKDGIFLCFKKVPHAIWLWRMDVWAGRKKRDVFIDG